MAVTGLVLPGELETETQLLAEGRLWGFNREFRPRLFDQRFFHRARFRRARVDVGAGANMAIRREAFDLVGLFDERLGAGAAGCSEDSELWYRLLAEGWSCVYEPDAVVFHHHRRELGAIGRQWSRSTCAATSRRSSCSSPATAMRATCAASPRHALTIPAARPCACSRGTWRNGSAWRAAGRSASLGPR